MFDSLCDSHSSQVIDVDYMESQKCFHIGSAPSSIVREGKMSRWVMGSHLVEVDWLFRC